jgi:hypothetical protein
LNQVSVNCIPHPGTTRLNFEAASPPFMVCINLVTKLRNAILAEEHGAFDFRFTILSALNLETKALQL